MTQMRRRRLEARRPKARQVGYAARAAVAAAKANHYAPVIAELQAAGTTSLAASQQDSTNAVFRRLAVASGMLSR
jgi:hypothetical protein